MTAPRIPYGLAKRILAGMKFGESCVIRPTYRYSFRKAARQLGRRVMENGFWTGIGEKRIRLVLLRRHDWITGHISQRMPTRATSGRFLTDSLLPAATDAPVTIPLTHSVRKVF